jgi:Rrf2 family iron-sulfur cluster assembly transcriptional regulator
MILSTKGRYAVMALVDIASFGKNKPVKLFSISERQGLDQGYLEQIFAKLKKTGLVKSVRGPGGGYILGRHSSEISISDIMFSVEENIIMTRCAKNSGEGCLKDKARCRTHHLWEDLGDHIYRFLRDISIEDVCNRNLGKSSMTIKEVSNG